MRALNQLKQLRARRAAERAHASRAQGFAYPEESTNATAPNIAFMQVAPVKHSQLVTAFIPGRSEPRIWPLQGLDPRQNWSRSHSLYNFYVDARNRVTTDGGERVAAPDCRSLVAVAHFPCLDRDQATISSWASRM